MQTSSAQFFTKMGTLSENKPPLFTATADFNNDQLLDMVSITEDNNANPRLNFYVNTVQNGFNMEASLLYVPRLQSWRGLATDLNADTLIDLLVVGRNDALGMVVIEAYKNKDHLDFDHSSTTTVLSEIQQLELADLDNDGHKELLMTGKSKSLADTMVVYMQKQGKFVPVVASLGDALGAFALVDMNADALIDMVASKRMNGKWYNHVFTNKGGLKFTASEQRIDSLELSLVRPIRLGVDTRTDLIVAGKDALGVFSTKIYDKNEKGTFVLYSIIANEMKALSVADFDHDGQSDLLYTRPNNNGTMDLSIVLHHDQDRIVQQFTEKILDFQVGDFDNEGNPDVVLFTSSETVFYKNIATRNLPPLVPQRPTVASFNNKVFFEWKEVADDASAPNQMTYEMYLRQDQGGLVYSPESSIPSGYRKVFRMGSLGHNTSHMLKNLDQGQYAMAVQAIDNALLSNMSCLAPEVSGTQRSGFSPEAKVLVCGQVAIKQIEGCEGTPLALQAMGSEVTNWYSVNKGFLSAGNIVNYIIGAQVDTVVSSSTESCANSILYVVVPKSGVVDTTHVQVLACAHSEITLTSPIAGAQWHSVFQDKVYTTDKLTYTTSILRDTIYVSYSQDLCVNVPVYVINVIDTAPKLDSLELCMGQIIRLEPQDQWTEVVWYNSKGRALNTVGAPTPVHYYPSDLTDNFIVQKGLYKTCQTTDTIRLNLHARPDGHVSADRPAVYGPTSLLATGGTSYRWYPSDGLSAVDVPNPVAYPNVTTQYDVLISNEFGCQDTVRISVAAKGDVFIPNLFSPNGDGNNDMFKLHGHGISKLLFKIYDRQGTVLFEADELQEIWDGRHNGSLVDSGTYTWTIAGSFVDGEPLRFQGATAGNITIIY